MKEIDIINIKNDNEEIREMFFTHEGFNTEPRIKQLKPNQIYKITFFFQTSKKVN